MSHLEPILARSCKLALAASLGVWACAPAATEAEPDVAPPNIVLVTLDTVRADHLSCYGYELPTSPRLDAFARQADLYERCYSTAPWTLPSHGSMFTGLFPFQHGAKTVRVEEERSNVRPLSLRNTTLAEFLAEAGYDTVAFVANAGFMTEMFKVHQGFDLYDVERKGGTIITRKARTWLEARSSDAPFFMFVNYMDAHRPYNAIPRVRGLPKPPSRESAPLVEELMEIVLGTNEPVPEELVRRIVELYDTGISNADFALGKLFDDFDRMGLMENTLFIITSDHGEYIGEHRLVEHSKDIYDEGLHVPLVVRQPGQTEGRVLDDLVCSVDVPSFVLDVLPDELAERGREIFPYRPGNHPVLSENYYSRTKDLFHPVWGERFQRSRFALYAGDYKYIHSTDKQNELFNLKNDPHELHNLCDDELDLAARFTKVMFEFRQRTRAAAGDDTALPTLTEEEVAELKALGYM